MREKRNTSGDSTETLAVESGDLVRLSNLLRVNRKLAYLWSKGGWLCLKVGAGHSVENDSIYFTALKGL